MTCLHTEHLLNNFCPRFFIYYLYLKYIIIKTKFLILILSITCLVSNFTNCKAQTFPWAKSAGGTGTGGGEGYSVSTDVSGNVFFAGDFSRSTITFGTYTLTKAGPGSAVFIAKYDANGNVLWAKSAGGQSGDGAYSVSTDTSGNAFITGYFSSPTIVFGTYTLTNAGSSSLFLTKYDINGNVLWAKSAGGSGIDFATGVSATANGSVFITGVLSSPTLAFGTTTLTNSSGNDAIFIVKYDPSGNVLWAKSAGGISNDESYAVSTDTNNNVFITGGF